MKHFAESIFDNNIYDLNRTAIVDCSGNRNTTWGRLYEMSCKVSAYVHEHHLSGVVPINMERSAETIAAALGFNLAGVGYTILNIGTPKSRIRNIEEQTENVCFSLKDFNEAMNIISDKPFISDFYPDDSMVLFTSGSTGTPKGVMYSDKALILAMKRCAEKAFFDYKSDDIVLNASNLSFAATIADIYSALFSGCTVHIAHDSDRVDANLLTEYINKHNITKFFVAPQMLKNLGVMPSVRTIICGGDVIRNIGPKGYTLKSVYGQTESLGFAFSYDIVKPMDITPIGKPTLGYLAYIIDDNGKLCDKGELCISGLVSSGYYKLEELTRSKFTSNPYSDMPEHKVLYHTGDIVERLPDGNMVFLYRKDLMLKINGQRVEPGEAEVLLKNHDKIKNVVVKGFTDTDKSYMCAFFDSDEKLTRDELYQYLADFLPNYSIPSYFVQLDSFPLNINGKIDREKLVIPDSILNSANEYVEPSNETESILCRAFRKVLSVDKIGINDDFISLGGDSISAMEIVRYAGIDGLTVTDILTARTPAEISKKIKPDLYNEFTVSDTVFDKACLTDSQTGIYLQCIQSPDSTMYNIPVCFSIERKKSYSEKFIVDSINQVISIHPSLYSKIVTEEDRAYMTRMCMPSQGLCTVVYNEKSDDTIKEYIRPFDLSKGPLCRVVVFLTDDKADILIDTHHIVCDGTSCAILCKQICSKLAGNKVENEMIDAFTLYSIESKIKKSPKYLSAKKYYSDLFSGMDVNSTLLFDKKEQSNSVNKASVYKRHIKLENIDEYLKNSGLTHNSFFMGVYGYVLGKFTNQNQSVFAFAENGRKSPSLKNTVSMMVKTIPVYIQFDENENADVLLSNLQNQIFNSIDNDIYSFVEMSEELSLNADTMFVYQSQMLSDIQTDLGTVSYEVIDTEDAFTKFALSVFKVDTGYDLVFKFRDDLYNLDTVVRFADLFSSTADAFIEKRLLNSIDLINESDKQFLNTLNANYLKYDSTITFLDVFKQNCLKFRDKIAVKYKERQYTYGELDSLSDKLAKALINKGIGKNNIVPILIPRNEYMVIASIGVLKTGAMYLPLDPANPPERLNFLCSDTQAELVVADISLCSLLNDFKGEFVFLQDIDSIDNDLTVNVHVTPDNPFLLLYTSGSTGTPKGTQIRHSNVLAFINAYIAYTGLNDNYNVSQFASYGFDSHILEIYPTLYAGGTVYIIHDEIRLDLPAIKDFCDVNRINILFMTTQVARQFATEIEYVDSLKTVITGGETLAPFEPKCNYHFHNCYGPSECTVMCSGFYVDKYYDSIPIGKNISNFKFYVVDSYDRRVPVGVPGELVICGPQVGFGYYQRPEMSEKAFVKNNYSNDNAFPFDRCYKSGDVVRFLDDGNIQFIGRQDSQVKIRGFRIELPEVESAIRQYPGVSDATVIAKDTPNGKAIYAYFVSDSKIDVSDLHNYIRKIKPSYMVPAASMQIPEIPLTPNMKVDKKKLPDIAPHVRLSSETREEYTALELSLLALIKDITGNSVTDISAFLTDIGITSITSIKLSVEILKRFNVKISSKELLDECSILELENKIVRALLENSSKTVAQNKPKLASYPLTQTQMGIYLECMLGSSDAYNIPVLYKLPHNVDVDKLKSAVIKAFKAHQSLLCSIHTDANGDLAVYPDANMDIDIVHETVDSMPADMTRFEFNNNPLFKIRILNYGHDSYLFIELHHIVCDGESVNILLNDIEKAYSGIALQNEDYTAFDLSIDEQASRSDTSMKTAREYYSTVFSGLSSDYIPISDEKGDDSFCSADIMVDTDLSVPKDYCIKTGISENVFFTGAFAVTLSKFVGHDDAYFATVHNGRTDPRTSNLVSMLVKTLPVYTPIYDLDSVSAFFRDLDEKIKNLKKFDIYSFADAAHDFGLNADVMFIYQGKILPSFKLDGEELKLIPTKLNRTKAKISLELYEETNGYRIHIEYNGGIYSKDFIDTFAEAYSTCINSIVNNKKLCDVDITSKEAFNKFSSFNDTSWDVHYRPAYRILQDTAEKYPDRLAVISSGEKLTYSQLDNMSNYLAKQILDAGITPRQIIEIITDRTKEVYIAQNGILKSGCAFLYLSPEYPLDRITYVSNDAKISAVVTTHKVYDRRRDIFDEIKVPVLFADDVPSDANAHSPNIDVGPNDLCYVIYTSGSTGKPKGVKLCNKGLINFVDNNPKNPVVSRLVEGSTVSSAVTSFTFDASIHETYTPFAAGMTICLASDEEIHNPALFTKMCLENHVTTIFGTPSLELNMLEYPQFGEAVRNLVSMSAGGEAYPITLGEKLRALNPNITLVNCYGPTEATVCCSSKILDSLDNITLGTPIVNTEIYVLDKFNHVLPMGSLGEMVVCGVCVGRGYINRPELNEKSFIMVNGKPAYKTGDLALISHHGEIEYHGRIDNQVKLRGLRVELGEIENAIIGCEGVKSCIVVVYGDEKNKYLAAYFTADRDVSKDTITQQISKTLTEYMVPKVIVQLDKMPLTVNGKIDKKALPVPEQINEKREYVAPSNDTEKILCNVFEEVLGVEQVGVLDDFFELGGTSLSATKVAMYALSHDISIVYADIFKNPTVRALARLVDKSTDISVTYDADASTKKYDYTNVNRALEGNVWTVGSDPGNKPLGNILLTGATGFLGMHILHHFIKNESGDVYCLIRKGNDTSMEVKLLGMYIYYFDESIEDIMGKRIHCIDGDITDKDLVMSLDRIPFDTLINCAACVKHFANDDVLNKVNVYGVENLTELCLKNNKRLIHISTVSVAGEGIDGNPPKDKKLHENELYFNQIVENDYILSKFNSERVVLEAVSKGLDAKIMRAGNLMPRRSDGEFQINYSTNGFMRRLHGYYAVGCVPYSALGSEFEFSPIDETAGAMLTLAKSDKEYNVFHANNTHTVYLADVIRTMNDVGLKVDVVDENEFSERLKMALEDTEKNLSISGLIAYLNREVKANRYMLGYDNVFSRSILNRMGYYWHITDDVYLKNALTQLRDIGFFDFIS